MEVSPLVLRISDKLYDNAAITLTEVYADPTVDDFYLVFKTLTLVSTLVEIIEVKDIKLGGRVKRKVVLHLCRRLLIDNVEAIRIDFILKIFDFSSSQVLEEMINFAKNNKLIKKIEFPFKCTC